MRLGELLVQAGVITAEKLAEALAAQQSEPVKRRLGTVLVERGFIDETQLTQVLGRQLSVPWVSLYHVDFSRQLLNLVPREVAEGFGIIPVYVRHVRGQGDTLYVATDDPTNDEGLKRVGAYAGLPVRPMIASAGDIRSAIRVYYGGGTVLTGSAPAPAPADAPALAPAPAPDASVGMKKAETVPPTRRESGKMSVSVSSVDSSVDSATTTRKPDGPRLELVAPGREGSEGSEANPPAAQPTKSVASTYDDAPEIEAVSIPLPARRGKAARTIALTFLDGTTISLPAPKAKTKTKTAASPQRPQDQDDDVPPVEERSSQPPSEGSDELTARDLISALRAVSHGADASEILGENPRWEALFAALLSLLLKKRLIADWEFVEEFRKI